MGAMLGITSPFLCAWLALALRLSREWHFTFSAEARIARGNNSAGLAREPEELFRKRVLDIETRV
jgi:hypothetical protein